MDAAEHIPSDERAAAVAAGLSSGSGIVRLAALPVLAALDGLEAARAEADPSARVRPWTRVASAAHRAKSRTTRTDETDRPDANMSTGQRSMF
jgi:hypothetical protein